MFVIIDGIDGCGKSTQVKALAESLSRKGHSAVVSKWQDSSYIKHLYIGDLLKRIQEGNVVIPPESRTFLLGADVVYRLESKIKPLLQEGRIVIGDRYIYKIIAQGIARGLDRRWLADLFEFVPEPEVKIMLDVPAEVALKRIMAGREISFYEAGLDVLPGSDKPSSFLKFQRRVRREFLTLMEHVGGYIVDGTLPLEEQSRLILNCVEGQMTARTADVPSKTSPFTS